MNSVPKRLFFKREVVDGLLDYSHSNHPREGILLIRGKVKKDEIVVTQLIIPPLATHGESFSSFPTYMLPLDTSILGVAHSHPSGTVAPSHGDLQNFWGRLMVIIGYPYEDEGDIGVFDREGTRAIFTIID